MNRYDEDHYCGLAEDYESKWTQFIISPYVDAYGIALNRIKETFTDQEKLAKMQADFIIAALSICSGGIMTHIFAETSAKIVAKNLLINQICKNNWSKAFNLACLVEGNRVASFVLGRLWDNGLKSLNDQAKQKITESFAPTPNNFPNTDVSNSAFNINKAMNDFNRGLKIKYKDTIRELFNDKNKITEKDRQNAIDMMLSSRFAIPPSSSPFIEKLDYEIELLFYLRMVMDSDFTLEQIKFAGGYIDYPVGIDSAPFTKHYPQGDKVRYRDLGRKIYDKINTCHIELYKIPLLDSATFVDKFNATINTKSFLAAYVAMLKLEAKGMSRFQNTIF